MLVREAITEGTNKLRAHKCDGANAQLESEALLAQAIGLTRERFFMALDRALTAAEQRKYASLVARRANHEPLAWLLGTGWFMDREFIVTEDTLIPRPATEHVVEAAIAAAQAAGAEEAVDVGTGSGCIAVSLALALPQAHVFATDVSIPAFVVARKNAKKHGVFGRMTLRKTNLLGYAPVAGHASIRPIPLKPDGTVVIVANLPYLPSGMRTKLSKCVQAEPASALFSGKDGLDASRALVTQMVALTAKLPNKKVIVAYEILANQFVPLAAYLKKHFPRAKPERIKNHQGVTVGLLATLR